MFTTLLTTVTEAAVETAAAAPVAAEGGVNLSYAAIGAGLAVIGAGFGIGKAAATGNEAIARQPEAAADIKGNALILSALIEGATLFAVVVALLFALK